MKIRITLVALCLAGVAAAACDTTPMSGPPTLKLGRSECAECGMLINEDRCSSGVLAEQRGRRDYFLYDDIGCMLDHEHEGLSEHAAVERYVLDHGTREWVRAETAAYLFTDPKALPTPMGSGIVAFARRGDADAARTAHGGEVIDFKALVAARRVWLEQRYGKPGGK